MVFATQALAACPHCNAADQDGVFCWECDRYMPDVTGSVKKVTFPARYVIAAIENFLLLLTLGVGWLIWLFFTAPNAQTPAKQLAKIYILDATTGRSVSAGRVWVRDALIKPLIFVLSVFLWGIPSLVNAIIVLTTENRQAGHDKVMNTIVVYAPNGLPESLQGAATVEGTPAVTRLRQPDEVFCHGCAAVMKRDDPFCAHCAARSATGPTTRVAH